MPAQLKKLNNYNKPFWTFILSPKRLIFLAIAAIVFTGFMAIELQKNAYAATGINRTINFQGKVVNRDGTNVADGQYTFVFKLWDASSGGSNSWTETQNNVQVTAGIFRVSLGSVTSFASAGVDFNTDNLYLGINFNSDGEMTPRVRFAAVPYAINAETVAGLTVTNTTGTLTIPNSKTVQFGGAFTTSAQDLTLTLSGGTNVTLPTTGTLATLGGTENLSNKTFTSTVTISGVTTDLTTGTNESLTITPNGTGNVLINPAAGGQAALVVNKTGTGDIFSASSAGITKFTIKSDGTASSSAGFTVDGVGSIQSTQNQSLTIGGGSTGELTIGRTSQKVWLPGFDCSGSGNGGKLTTTSGGVLTCAADGGGSSGDNFWQYNVSTGIVANGNLTTDLLLGGTSTNSAKFAVLGIAAGTNPTASVSATSGSNLGNGIVIAGNGTIQSLRNNTLTLGGNTSGELVLKSRNVTVFQNPGTGNTLIGENAGSLSNSASSNTFIGFEAGLNNSNNSNTFIGYTAGRTNGSGTTNTFVGQSAGYANNGGGANSFFGFEAGRYTNAGNNTFIGQRAGYTNNSGTNNVFLGFEAGESPVGANANVSGANNVFIGYQSGPASTTQLTNAGAIGYQALVNASNALVLGGTGANALNVGIGTTTPLSALQVVGGNMGGNAAFILNQTGVSTNDLFAASASGTTKFVIKNDGTASSAAGFTINAAGALQTTNNQTLTIGGNTTGEIVILPGDGGGDIKIGFSGAKNNTSSTYMEIRDHDLVLSETGSNHYVKTSAMLGGGMFLGSTPNVSNQDTAFQFYDYSALQTPFWVGHWRGTSRFATKLSVYGVDGCCGPVPAGTLDVRGDPIDGGTLAIASISGTTSIAGLIVDNNGIGSIFTASTGGVPKFTIKNSGAIQDSTYTIAGGIFYADGSGNFLQTTAGNSTECLKSAGGGTPTWGSCGGASGDNFWQYNASTGIVANGNLTTDLLLGGISTQSAMFSVLGIAAGTNPSASVSAQSGANANKGVYMSGNGSIQSTRNNSLTLGGDTTGNIIISPNNGSGFLNLNSPYVSLPSGAALASAPDSVLYLGGNSTATVGQSEIDLYLNGNTGSALIGKSGGNQQYFNIGTNGQWVSNFSATSGNLLQFGSQNSPTQTAAITGASFDLNSGLAVGNTVGLDQTGIRIRLKDGGANTIATGISLVGNADFGLDLRNLNATTSAVFGNGFVGIGSSALNPIAALDVEAGNLGGRAVAIFNQVGNSANDILTASASGVTKFTVTNAGTATMSGNLVINSAGSLQTTKFQTLTIGGSSTGDISLMPRNGTGFVGIGTASPAYPLDLLSTTNPQVRFGYDTSNYMTLQIGSTGISTFDAIGSGAAFNFKDAVSLGISSSTNGVLQFNNSAGGTPASITTNASGDLLLQSSSGLVNLGVGSGDITIDPGTNNIVANLTTGNFIGQKGSTNYITLSTTGTLPVASMSGRTSFAALLTDNSGVGDLFTASASGATRLKLTSGGSLQLVGGQSTDLDTITSTTLKIGAVNATTLTIGRTSQGITLPGFDCSGSGSGGKLTTTSGGVLTCAADGGSSGAAGTWTLNSTNGTHTPINNTADLLVGGASTQSAMFSVLGLAAGTNPSASVSAQNGANANKGIYMSGDGSLQSVRNNFLTLGGNTTGDIYLRPLNSTGMVRIIHGNTGTGGLELGDFETDAQNKTARIKSMPYNPSTSYPVTMMLASNQSSVNQINIGGGSASEYAATDIFLRTAANNTTLTGTTRLFVGGASGFVSMGDDHTSPVARLDILDNATDINGQKLVIRRTGAGDVGMSFQQNGVSAFGIVNRSGSGNGLAFVDNYYEGSNGTEIARFYASSGVGIGTLGVTPVATLDVRGVFTNSGTQPVASLSGRTSFAALTVDNSGTGDIFTASSSGLNRFVVKQGGNVGIGTTNPLAKLQIDTGATTADPFVWLTGNGGSVYMTNSAESISTKWFLSPGNNNFVQGSKAGDAGFALDAHQGGFGFGQASGWSFYISPTGTDSTASVSARTTAAALSVLQSGSGDLITASTSGTTASLSGVTKFNVNFRGTVAASDFVGHDVVLGTSSASMIYALKGYEGYTNFSGGIGTGGTGIDSLGNTQRLTSNGNLVNIGSIQAGEALLTTSGTFGATNNYTVGNSPRHTAIGDVNGDGYPDLVVANSSSPHSVSVLFNNGSGAFVPKVDYTTGASPVYVALGDVNGDGRLDIVTANSSASSVSVLINNGGGTFATKTDYFTNSAPSSVALGDLNGDGKADLAVANTNSTNVSVLINNGNGTFANKADYTTGSLPTIVAMGDLNGDGFADLAVSNNGSTSVSVLINNRDGTFATKSDLTVGANPRSVAIADVNGDYKSDIVASNYTDGTVSVLINNGGSFATQATYNTGTNPQGVAVGDMNGDGKVDIATADNTITAVSVLMNSGSGTFPTSTNYTVGNSPYAVAIADLNADGKQDLVATNNGAGTNVSVLLNQTLAMFFAQASSGRVGIGTTSPLASLDVRATGANGGTVAVASVSGATSHAAFIVDNSGSGDLFTASTSGLSRFTIKSNGVASASGGFTINNVGSLQTTKAQLLTIGGDTTGDISFKPGNSSTSLYLASTGALGVSGSFGALGQCLLSNGAGAAASWGGCAAGAAGGWFNLVSSQGTIVPVNQTLDLLWGGNSTASAGFRIAGATKNYGTVAAASVSANTSFAGMVIDNRGTGELLTASSSGLTRFTIYNSGDVVIGNGADAGYKLDVKGSVRIGNNTATDDIVKDSSVDFTQSGYAITTNDSVNTVSTSENQIKLVTDLIGAGASLTAPAADQTTGTNVTTGSVAFQRPDKKFVVYVGGAATSKLYDPVTGVWGAGPSTAGAVSMGAGAKAFQRQNGSFLILHGGAASSTSVYAPGGSANLGTTIVGPTTTAAVGAGSQIIRRTDGKILVIHGNTSTTSSVHDPVTATGTTSLIGTFIAGPATTGNVVAGSFVFQKPDGKWILGLGGGTTTNLYDPSSSGVGGGGTFSAGPALTTGTPGAGTHVIQLPDGRFMVLIGGSGNTQIYNWKSDAFTAGPTLVTDTLGAGAHSFQRSDGKWVVVVGGNSKNLQLYDPTSGADGSFSQLTGANGLQGATGAGAGALTFQRPDGKYIVVHGNTVQLTTLYDAGWNTTGTWTSEDILNTKISTYSAMIWSANPQSANNNARLDSETINIGVKTGDTLTSLGNNPYRTLQDSGDLIKSYGNSQYAKIQVTFTVPIRSYPGGATAYLAQSNIWDGEGGTFLRRSFIQPVVFSMRIQNPLVGYGDPSGQGDPAFGRNFATASAQLEGVGTDNSNRLTLLTLRNQPTSTASAGIIIASASANLGGNAGAGAHTIERNNGQFITILGGGATTTRTYDSDTNVWTAGPDLPNAAGAGAHSFLMPDGRFFVVLGNTTNKTAIFDPQANLFQSGPNLFGNVGSGANSFQRPDGYFVILNGGGTSATNILDPYTMAVTQGPYTTGATPNVGGGSLNIKRSDGRILVVLGNGNAIATGTNVYDPASNSFAAGPALVGGAVNTGGNAVQLNTGRIILFKSTATSNWYDPILNTFAAGPTPTANGAGSFVIPRSDGKIFKANGGNAATTNIIDPQSGVAVTGTSAPTLPCNVNTGGHTFQRPTGEYVVICGGSTANTLVIDAGWNLGGTYTTEQIQVPNLSSTSSIFWKNIGQGNITVKYRTASSQQALGVASWKDAITSGSYLSPTSGDTWIQARFDLQGYLQDLPGAKTRVWNGSDAGGNMVYYRPIQAPILEYWKVMNIQDPTLLTLSSGGNNAFRFSSDGQAYTSDTGAWNSGGADLAERYQSQDTLEAGEVVSLDRLHSQNTKRSTLAYDQNAMGVVSTQPGFVAGAYTENSYPIALVGRVPVKVSTENGEIHAGDYLTSASIPGYAMKATVAGRVLGQAMEDFDLNTAVDCPKFGAGNLITTKCGTITVFVNLTSYNGESVDVAMKDAGYALKEEELPAIAGIDFTSGTNERRQQEVLGFLKTQKDNGQAIYADRVAATQEIISPQIVTDLLIAKKIKAESIEGLEIITNSIEKLTDQMASGSAVANFSDRLNVLSLNQKDFETQMASLSAKLDKMGAMNILSFIANGSQSGDLTMVNNFASYGTTTLSEVSVMNSMTIGSGSTLTLSNNSINTLGDELSIQPLRQAAVSFLGGLIRFDTDGKATFAEDVTFAKNVGVAGVLSAKTVSSTELQLGQGSTSIISDTEVTATAAAGLVTLKRNTDHVKVNNPLVRDNSFIFITPKTKTMQQLFLLDQIEGTSFTVGVDGKSNEDIKFNYLIVN